MNNAAVTAMMANPAMLQMMCSCNRAGGGGLALGGMGMGIGTGGFGMGSGFGMATGIPGCAKFCRFFVMHS